MENKRVFIGNLDFEVTENELKACYQSTVQSYL